MKHLHLFFLILAATAFMGCDTAFSVFVSNPAGGTKESPKQLSPGEQLGVIIHKDADLATFKVTIHDASTACLGFLRHHRATFAIKFAVAIIPVERARARGLMRSCIAEETTQVLGLLNDAEVPGTLFNDAGDARDLTPLDEMLVRLLYHPSLRPGMRRAEALEAARRALPSLRAGK